LNAAGQTLVVVTHNVELAERYASRVIRLADGRVISDTGAVVRTRPPGPVGQPEARR
jgi:ABC-type phosphate/phosphonate transport system ATPase subunit